MGNFWAEKGIVFHPSFIKSKSFLRQISLHPVPLSPSPHALFSSAPPAVRKEKLLKRNSKSSSLLTKTHKQWALKTILKCPAKRETMRDRLILASLVILFIYFSFLCRCVNVSYDRLLTKCEVKMAGYWPSSFFCVFMDLDFVLVNNTQKKNFANIQPSWPNP